METVKFVRKPFEIEAVQVTQENLGEVNAWCNGTLSTNGEFEYIQVRVHHPLTPRQTQAFVGDWVLASKKGFKVYTDQAFKANFSPSVTIPDSETDRFSTVFKDCYIEPSEGETRNAFSQGSDEVVELLVVDPKDAISGKL